MQAGGSGIESGGAGQRGGALGLNYATIAELLQDAGYATYATGKWDLGDIEGYTPGGTESTPWRLYDLAEDPGETRDLAAESPELVAELVREWEANWR